MGQNELKELNIRSLFKNKDKYIIPIYQRNYAWNEVQINQLIQDIYDFAIEKKFSDKNYYIGTLVVDKQDKKNKKYFETIDGQQRLTALNIILSVLKNELDLFFDDISKNDIDIDEWYTEVNLEFAIRDKSTNTLIALFEKDEMYIKDNYNPISQSYDDSIKYMRNLFENKEDLIKFHNFLSKNVVILRVKVPKDTDLNHYFEIMNTRGEQLEKHEILKSNLISILNDSDEENLKETFNIIWNACFNMDRYVQYEFKNLNHRKKIFGSDWNTFTPNNFDEIVNIVNDEEKDQKDDFEEVSLKNFIESGLKNYKLKKDDSKDSEDSIRFTSVINFSNFILHILRIQINKMYDYSPEKNDVSLEDKNLLPTF